MRNKSDKTIIIGSGPAGLGAADSALEKDISYHIYESDAAPFGHCKSFTLADHPEIYFDEGPHISFTKNPQVQKLFAESCPDFLTLQPKMLNYWKGSFIDHPVQNNLAQVPEGPRFQIIEGIKKRIEVDLPKNYDEWLKTSFGNFFTQEFHEVYTQKYWTLPAHQMTTDWIGQRVSRPSAQEMISSASANKPSPIPHYFTHFRYPHQGGFETFLKKSFQSHKDAISLNSRVESIDLKLKKLTFSNGQTDFYQNLVSSIPLDMITILIKDCPRHIFEASKKLSMSSVTLFSIIYKKMNPPPSHWMYIYDQDIPFARLYFPRALANQTSENIQAVQVEVYSSKYLPLTARAQDEKVIIDSLEKMNLLKAKDVLKVNKRFCSHANVIFDHDRAQNREIVLHFLSENNVKSVGRFGDWAYLWSDDSYLSGFHSIQ